MRTREGTLDDFIVNEVKSYLKLFNFKKTDNVLDLGGNIGAFSKLISGMVKSVTAYEPEIENYELFVENTRKCDNVISKKLAVVGNDDKFRSFFVNSKKNKGTHTLIHKRGREEIKVPCINVNDVIGGFNKIKMDIEGGEYELIKNIKDFSGIEEMVIEYHFSMLNDKDKKMYYEFIDTLKNNFINVKYNKDPGGSWTTIVYCGK